VNRLPIIDPLLRSSLLMAASRMMSLLVLIAVAPLVVAQLGVEGYGVWEAIATIQSSIAVLHSVVGAVCLLAFSRLHGAGTHNEAQELASRLRGGFLIVGVVTAILFGGMGLALVSVVKAPPEVLVHAQLATVWTALACGLATVNQVTVALVAGSQRTGSAALVQSIGTMIGAVAMVASLESGWGLLALPVGITVGAIATELLAARAVIALFGSLSFARLAIPTMADFRKYGRYALMLLLTSATVLFRDQADRLLVASTETALATAALAISARAGSIVLQLAAALLMPMAAAIGAALAKGDLAACRSLYQRYSQLLIALVGSIAIGVVWLREPLLVAWLGESLDGAAPFVGWSLLGVMAATLLSAPAMVYARANGDAKPELWAAIVTLTLVLVSKPLATLAFGGVGATASSALSWAVGSAIFLAIVHVKYTLPAGTAGRLVAATVLTSALLALSYWVPIPGSPQGRWTALASLLIWTGPITLSYLATLALLGVIDGRSLLKCDPSSATQLTATPLGDAQRLYRKSA
jgi:O-antigen/teichoic acid export membrane protein